MSNLAADIAMTEPRIEIDLGIKHHFFPNIDNSEIYAKEMLLPAGYYAVSHKHKYDHISVLYSGAVVVEIDGVESEYRAAIGSPAFVLIRAGANHKITAIADAVWFCVHATSETDTDHIDNVLIEGE